jgi:hypothetical protein
MYMYVCMYIYIYIHTYVYIYIYIYIPTRTHARTRAHTHIKDNWTGRTGRWACTCIHQKGERARGRQGRRGVWRGEGRNGQ